MTIENPGRLAADLRAVIASITPDQISILTSIQEVLNERISELREEIEADERFAKENNKTEDESTDQESVNAEEQESDSQRED